MVELYDALAGDVAWVTLGLQPPPTRADTQSKGDIE
jgi:hypothetical protein